MRRTCGSNQWFAMALSEFQQKANDIIPSHSSHLLIPSGTPIALFMYLKASQTLYSCLNNCCNQPRRDQHLGSMSVCCKIPTRLLPVVLGIGRLHIGRLHGLDTPNSQAFFVFLSNNDFI